MKPPARLVGWTLAVAGSCVGATVACQRVERARTQAAGGSATAAAVAIAQNLESATVSSDGPTALDGMTLEEIVRFRRQRVAAQAALGIFPPDYDPLRGLSARIWTPITSGGRWLGPTPYYVANPYVLIVLVDANRVTALNLACPEVTIFHTPGRIDERRDGSSARCWLDMVHDPSYAEHPGAVRIVMVNAFDAGLRFAHVDRALSANLHPEADRANVVNGLFSQSSFFHLGRKGKNNISPEDPRGWVRLADARALTRIHVKLWRDVPLSPSAPADFIYEATIAP